MAPDDGPNEAPPAKVIPHLRDALLKEMDGFWQLFHAKSSDEHALVGRVAYCQVIMEHYLAKHIETLLPGIGEISNLGFRNLLRLGEGLTHKLSMVQLVAKEMNALNELRNTIAHNLKADLSQNPNLVALRDFLKSVGAPNPAAYEPVSVIEKATLFVVVLLSAGSILKREGDAIEEERAAIEKEMWDIDRSLREATDRLFGEAMHEVQDDVLGGPKE
jgi:hypothetical protein